MEIKLEYYKKVSFKEFEKILKRRISKIVRKYEIIKPNKKVEIVNEDDCRSYLLLYYFYFLLKDSKMHEIIVSGKKVRKENRKIFEKVKFSRKKYVGDIILIPYCLEDACIDIVKSMVNNKKPKIVIVEKKKGKTFARPLILIPEEEIKIYLKAKKISFGRTKRDKISKKILKAIKKIEKIKKDSMFCLFNFFFTI